MKLFQIADRKEGELPLWRDYFISLYRHYESNPSTRNGWKLMVNFPIKIRRKYVDPLDFEVKTGPCTVFLSLQIRKIRGQGRFRLFRHSGWSPSHQE